MQAAGTLRGTRVISLLALLVSLIGYAYSSPLQYLPNIPGYVPVYIRYGDEPLADINPQLAEAFGETSSSVKLDRTLVSDNFKDNDIDVLLEESAGKHAYPLRVRATENSSFSTVSEDEPTARNRNSNKPKLLTIYQLPDDNDNKRNRRRNRGRQRNRGGNKRAPPFKVGPLSEAEKEELEKLAMEVEKEETRSNDLYVPSSKSSESSRRGMTRNRHKAHRFTAPVKVQDPLEESSMDLPEINPRIDDDEKPSNNRNNAAPKADKSDTSTRSRDNKRQPPIKEQRPATMLSNVDKLSPIDLPDESATEENKTRSSTQANDEVATTE